MARSSTNKLILAVWWPGIYRDSKNFVSECLECNRARPRTVGSTSTWPTSQPWERVHFDWAHGPNQGDIFILVDAGSGWIEAVLSRSRDAEGKEDIGKHLFQVWYSGSGCPR
eukprot:Pompholyxophrys_punicea_v1_NODE_416_length_2017_cov_2.186544.p3 type:complete len:112 gc:universal NODE_416_length_2017_cov_2.186544:1428-1093(-)